MPSTEPAVSVPRRENMTATSGMCQRLHPSKIFIQEKEKKKANKTWLYAKPKKTKKEMKFYVSGKQYLD